jgi:hypothetical protein
MNDLSPDARAVLDAGRSAHDPDAQARARVRDAVRARLANSPPPASRALAKTLPWALAALCVVAVVAWRASRVAPPPPRPAVIEAPAVRVPAAVAPTVFAPVDVTVLATPPVVAPTVARAPVVRRDEDTLAEELRLVNAARSSLAAGQPQAALRTLDAHARRFPRGQLAEERDATRALARCAQAPAGERGAVADAFVAAHPRSPSVTRVRRACAGASP